MSYARLKQIVSAIAPRHSSAANKHAGLTFRLLFTKHLQPLALDATLDVLPLLLRVVDQKPIAESLVYDCSIDTVELMCACPSNPVLIGIELQRTSDPRFR